MAAAIAASLITVGGAVLLALGAYLQFASIIGSVRSIELADTQQKGILGAATILDMSEVPTDHVGIGTVVTVKEVGTKENWELTLVGSYEADPDEDRISNESPIGEALSGKRVGDVVEVKTPGGKMQLEVVAIRRQGA